MNGVYDRSTHPQHLPQSNDDSLTDIATKKKVCHPFLAHIIMPPFSSTHHYATLSSTHHYATLSSTHLSAAIAPLSPREALLDPFSPTPSPSALRYSRTCQSERITNCLSLRASILLHSHSADFPKAHLLTGIQQIARACSIPLFWVASSKEEMRLLVSAKLWEPRGVAPTDEHSEGRWSCSILVHRQVYQDHNSNPPDERRCADGQETDPPLPH